MCKKAIVDKVIDTFMKDLEKEDTKWIRYYIEGLEIKQIKQFLAIDTSNTKEILIEIMFYQLIIDLTHTGDTSSIEDLLMTESENDLLDMLGE